MGGGRGVCDASCGSPSDEAGDPDRGDGAVEPSCESLPGPAISDARIHLAPGEDAYRVELVWDADLGGDVVAEVASEPFGAAFDEVMSAVAAREGGGVAFVDKLLPDIFVRLRATHADCATRTGPVARLAKPDYADPARWDDGWIRVVSHTHTRTDDKLDNGPPIHTNHINWFTGCYEVIDDHDACNELLWRSFDEQGVRWLVDAARDRDISSVIVTDHDNVGIWFTDTFRAHNRANPDGPSVVPGLEWTSGLGHLTVIGNFLPDIPADADIYDPEIARLVHTSTPVPPDYCDDTDENHSINHPDFDGPDAPCARDDHRGHGDDPVTIEETRERILRMQEAGALVFANHPTNDSIIEPPMGWKLENYDLLDGVEINVPEPNIVNRGAPRWWRERGLDRGFRWRGIAGTDCHVDRYPFDGSTGCNSFHGLIDFTHMDAPYMWLQPLGSTSRAAVNDPDLVVAAIREGRITSVQDVDPAVVVDLAIDATGDEMLDYWSGSTVWACEQPERDEFEIQIRVRPVQSHNYNVSVWINGEEDKILQREALEAGETWTGSATFRRSTDIPAFADFGYVMVQVREDLRLRPDNDAGFSNPIFFQRPYLGVTPCDTLAGAQSD